MANAPPKPSAPPPPAAKKPPPKALPKAPPKPTAPPPIAKRVAKTFTVQEWGGDAEGEKIIIHGKWGMGKTTLAAMAPTPVWIGLDDGGRKVKDPRTGEDLKVIPGIETFWDVRDALHQIELFDSYETVVIDTGTELQHLGLIHTFETVRGPKECPECVNIEDYGWHKGYRYLYDTMHHILGDLNPLIKRGKNVIIICQTIQAKVSNSGGEDFLCDTPDLQVDAKANVAGDYMSWSDHIFMIDHHNVSTSGKKATATGGRVIRTQPEIHFEAKTRCRALRDPEYATITFKDPEDDSIWQFLFGGE